LKRSWSARWALGWKLAAVEFLVIRSLEIGKKIVEIFAQMPRQDRNGRQARPAPRVIRCGLTCQPRGPWYFVLGDPRTERRPTPCPKLDNGKRTLQQPADCVLQMHAGRRRCWGSVPCTSSDVASPYFSVMLIVLPARHSGAVADLSSAAHRVREAKSYDSPSRRRSKKLVHHER